jgi:hypothetical protein
MFRPSKKEKQLDMFSSISGILKGTSGERYNDQNSWHNVFYRQVLGKIDETLFKPLYSEQMGAPNASIRILVGMMILKEAFGWSDEQLYEQCRFNLLVRGALGLWNLHEEVPVESTYYLTRKRIYEYQKKTGENLIEKVFIGITRGQVKEFNVNGRAIRMDSKLVGSNIAFLTRYEIIHKVVCGFYRHLKREEKERLPEVLRERLEKLSREESEKIVYRSTREEIKTRLQEIGWLMYQLEKSYSEREDEAYLLLQRVFHEQYKIKEEEQVELRPKEEITSDSLQSPHDPESAYRNKNNESVKGYSINLSETVSDEGLNLITSVIVEKANVPDTGFVKPAIESTMEITGQQVEKVYADGAYQSPENDILKTTQMVYTGIQGASSRYELDMTPEGLIATDIQTGEQYIAVPVKKHKNSREDRWRIKTPQGYKYFGQQAIRAARLRKELKNRLASELNKRSNIEATIFQFSYPLRNNKSRYRGKIKHIIWAFCRCLWLNLVRIVKFIKKNIGKNPFFPGKIIFSMNFFRKKLLQVLKKNIFGFTNFDCRLYLNFY